MHWESSGWLPSPSGNPPCTDSQARSDWRLSRVVYSVYGDIWNSFLRALERKEAIPARTHPWCHSCQQARNYACSSNETFKLRWHWLQWRSRPTLALTYRHTLSCNATVLFLNSCFGLEFGTEHPHTTALMKLYLMFSNASLERS